MAASREFAIETYAPKFDALARSRAAVGAADNKKAAEAFRDTAAKEEGALRYPSGLIYKTMKPGTGASPKASDVVSVHYHGTLPDGKVFDSSVQRGQPAEFAVNQVIPVLDGRRPAHEGGREGEASSAPPTSPTASRHPHGTIPPEPRWCSRWSSWASRAAEPAEEKSP